MKIAVLGAGAWGTALAACAAPAHEVLLWARDPQQARALREQRCNERYLPGVSLPAALQVGEDLAQALSHGREGLAIVATPMSGLRGLLKLLTPGTAVLWLCKGFESGTGALGHEIARAEGPALRAGVLSGPSFAQEVAWGQPTALVAASADDGLLDLAQAAFHSDSLRVYRSSDPVGVEVGGAVKNVLAIATGILDGLAAAAPGSAGPLRLPGLNARAALITRGLAEMTRLGVALGAQGATFMGLSGLGDLVLTATGSLSRNRQVGLRLAAGLPLQQVLDELGHVAEGVYSARTVLGRARTLDVDMPITQAVVDVLEQRLTPPQAVARLMSREARSEA
ncbi:MAG: NAD(P)-dependent glycerol-3-phosphate dehydrogenase [Rubrivivax sp.]|nr:NAD(P)-dependent glycerol-3-phosphate dehydrogenase [Rubrivivax sp.]